MGVLRTLLALTAMCSAVVYLQADPCWFLQARFRTPSRSYLGDGQLRPTPASVFLPEWNEHGLVAWTPGSGTDTFPLVVTPARDTVWTVDKLTGWIASQRYELVEKHLLMHGALLFRGFPIETSDDFERMSLVLAPELEGDFFHSTPRSKFNNSKVVHTASDDAPWVVIPAHCERCWIVNEPKLILFFAQTPNQGSGGETPLTDFQRVWQDMDEGVRDEFVRRKLMYRRQFFDERRVLHDAVKTMSWPIPVSWQHMFGTSDLGVIESRRGSLGFDISWLAGETGHGILEATSVMPAFVRHPKTGVDVWHNHLNLLHISSPAAEYAFSAQHQSSWLYVALHYLARAAVAINAALFGDAYIGQTTVFGDDSTIPDHVIEHVRGLVWNNTLVYKHQPGDVVFVDNYRLAHGRQPYSGFRRILTSWA